MDREREVIKENKQVESRRKCFFYWLPEANDQCHLAFVDIQIHNKRNWPLIFHNTIKCEKTDCTLQSDLLIVQSIICHP